MKNSHMNYSMNSNKGRMPKTSGFLIRGIALLHNGQRLVGEIDDQTEFDTEHVLLARTKRVTFLCSFDAFSQVDVTFYPITLFIMRPSAVMSKRPECAVYQRVANILTHLRRNDGCRLNERIISV